MYSPQVKKSIIYFSLARFTRKIFFKIINCNNKRSGCTDRFLLVLNYKNRFLIKLFKISGERKNIFNDLFV